MKIRTKKRRIIKSKAAKQLGRRTSVASRAKRKAVTPRGVESATGPMPGGEVILYQPPGGKVQLDVRLERDTVWLTQQQMSSLFCRERSVITKHLRNVFAKRELEPSAVCANFAHTAPDGKTYQVEHYNLDVVISVGYRVNSKQGTQFRIWATQTLRDHLLRGYTLNEKRLRERGLNEVEQAIDLLSNTLRNQSLVTEHGHAVLDVVQHYTRAWRLLLQYDEDRLAATPANPVAPSCELTLKDARAVINDLRTSLACRNESSDLFGRERGAQLHGILHLAGMTRLTKSKGSLPRGVTLRPAKPQTGQWRLQDAKARFSELVRRVRSEGPQHVTVHGRDEVVVIAADEFRRLKGSLTGKALIEAMQASPYREIELDPSTDAATTLRKKG